MIAADDAIHELDGLFVEPDHLRQGIGSALVQDAAMRATANAAVDLEVTAGPAQAFYEQAGFVVPATPRPASVRPYACAASPTADPWATATPTAAPA